MPIGSFLRRSCCAVAMAVAAASAVSSSDVSAEGLALLQLDVKKFQSDAAGAPGAVTLGRALTVAGVEGTGHHLWWDLFVACSATGACREVSHDFSCAVADTRWTDGSANYTDDHPCPDMSEKWNSMGLSADGPLGLVFTDSYPCCSCCVPNLEGAYTAAQKKGDRLKVLVLFRNVRSLLWSNYERFKHDAALEIDGARHLKSQLEQVHPEDRICVDFEALPEMAQAMDSLLATWPNLPRVPHFDWKGELEKKLDVERADKSMKECEGSNAAICKSPELEAVMADLRGLCASSPRLFANKNDAGGEALHTDRTWTAKQVLQAIFDN